MKQRIRVVGIVKNENGVLILKRNRDRSEAPVFWELPSDKIRFGEQPEEAITRALNDYTGLSITSIRLKDVITFLAPEGASRLNNLYIVYEVSIANDDKPELLGRYTAYKFVKDLTGNNLNLSEASATVLEIEEGKVAAGRISSRNTASAVAIHVDGASRGNPGPSGIGFCAYDAEGKIIKQGGEFIGFATSRVAEYYAMKKGIQVAIDLGLKSARFFSDSLMVVNQLNGIFTVKNQDIISIHAKIKEMLKQFDNASFTFVPREQNAAADEEANKAIDKIIRPVI